MIEPTASLGKLFVDERNGYIGICATSHYVERLCTWFRITDVTNMALYCTKPRMMGKRVFVDCEFACDIPSQNIHIKRVIKTRICCQHHKYTRDSHYEEWEEPGPISIMRGIINQTYALTVQNEIRDWADKLHFIRDSLYEQALCMMMLPPDYTQEQLEQRYNAMEQALSDVNGGMQQDRLLLRKYYEILMAQGGQT